MLRHLFSVYLYILLKKKQICAIILFVIFKKGELRIVEKIKMDRINELAKKSKESPLTDEELAEQKALRQEYIMEIRASFGAMLDNTVIQYPDGSRKSLKKGPDN